MGRERDREELAASDPDTNDYLIEPCLDVEIIWRLRRNIKVGMEGSAQLQGLQFPWCALNKNDLYSVLLEEVNRGNRRSDSMGLVLIKVTGWSLLSMDYGPGVAQVVEDIILSRIQGIIRSYDAVFRIDQGRFVLLLPHTDRDGLTTFVRRVHNALHTILGNEAFAQDELEVVHVEGICVWTYSQSRPQTEAVKKLHAYIVKKVLSDRPGSDYVCIHLGAEEGTSVLRGNDCGESS
jgi:GGDEF domain-containing protein